MIEVEILEASGSTMNNWENQDDPTRMFNSFEFGPSWWFHLPMALIGVSWAIRLRKANFFAAANPALENGGLYNYSKFSAQNNFPQVNLPTTCLIHSEEEFDLIGQRINEYDIQFPFIIKPDIGERGKGVKLIANPTELERYLNQEPKGAYLIQDFIVKSQEYGVFFFKHPETGELKIPSLTRKIPLQIIGDGVSKVSELIQNHPRASRYQHLLHVTDSDSIPFSGELYNLSPMGNHCKGAVFLDYSEYLNPAINSAFERIFETVKGINYGRLDVKVDGVNDLSDPSKIIILEVNGANAEPIHMYSPEKNYQEGLRTMSSYFKTMAMTARLNLIGNRGHYRKRDTLKSLRSYMKRK